jgi:hypothetical protein
MILGHPFGLLVAFTMNVSYFGMVRSMGCFASTPRANSKRLILVAKCFVEL